MSYVVPVFTWLFPFYPLFSPAQQKDLDELYTRCLRRISFCLNWHPFFFMYASNQVSLEDRCKMYWERYLLSWTESTDGISIFSEGILNTQRSLWLQGEMRVRGMRRSKRYKENTSLLERCTAWVTNTPINGSTICYTIDKVEALREFPETL